MAKVHQGQAMRINRNCFFDAFALPPARHRFSF